MRSAPEEAQSHFETGSSRMTFDKNIAVW